MEWILLGILLLVFSRKKQGIPWSPFLPPNYEEIYIDPKLQAIIDKHGIHHDTNTRRISARNYNGR